MSFISCGKNVAIHVRYVNTATNLKIKVVSNNAFFMRQSMMFFFSCGKLMIWESSNGEIELKESLEGLAYWVLEFLHIGQIVAN